MENGLLLTAGIFAGACTVWSLFPGRPERPGKALWILWTLSAVPAAAAAALMTFYQITCRFEYRYVYAHVSLDTEPVYKVTALWSGQEGSFLLWALVMAVMGFFVLRLKGERASRVFGVYAAVGACVDFMCRMVRPFEKTDIPPSDGMGLAASLKDPWMAVHPPLVFIAYGAMAVLFALSASAAKGGGDSARRVRVWLRVSLFFLGTGILSGSVWAYRALGWGGYWSWDPIENAALVPWLLCCAFLHRRTGSLYPACAAPFSAACFGVFLARSGILRDRSVHAYSGGNAAVTGVVACFLFGASLFLLCKIVGGKRKSGNTGMEKTERRWIFRVLCVYAALILLGTAAPLFLGAETPVSYYTAVSVVFALALSVLFLLHDRETLKKHGAGMAAVSAALVVAVTAAAGADRLGWLLFLWICLMPLSLWIVGGFPGGARFILPHLAVLLLVCGAVASSALGRKGFAVARPENGRVSVAGTEIALSELSEKDVLIRSSPKQDLLIQSGRISELPENAYLIPYETKPLIGLFWAGGFAAAAAPLFPGISERLSKTRLRGTKNHGAT